MADVGPQKQPSSVAKIEAERKSLALDGWVSIGGGGYVPGPELSARLRCIHTDEDMKAFIREYSDNPEWAEALIQEMFKEKKDG